MDIPAIEASLGLWDETRSGHARLVNLSENHTFRVDAPAGRFMLRVHRPGYQSAAAIESELAWLGALQGALPVPRPLAGLHGRLLQSLPTGHHVVLFAAEPGIEPPEDGDLAPLFEVLGRYAARLHDHAQSWNRPASFTRQAWTAASILDPAGLWGDWRGAPGAEAVLAPLTALDRQLRQRLQAYGMSADRYGLIHADMRLANLLVDGDHVTLIDFDDCGFCWFLYDLAASLSFVETRRDLRTLIDAWVAGYTPVRPLTSEDLAMIEPMILLRRMALLAWIGSHGETDLAKEHAPRFAADTVALAARLLP